MNVSSECICIVVMLLAAGLTGLVIWYWMIEPKIALQKSGLKEGYIHFNRYRPAGDYRHQYFWKRPFLRYPYPFRRPFDYWKPIYYEQQPLEAIPEPKPVCKSIPSLEKGVARIPFLGEDGGKKVSSFSIAFDMRFYPAMSEDDKLLFRVGQAYPSPMMVYSPIDNTLAMILYTHFDGYTKKIVYAGDDLVDGEWNNIVWIQRGQWMMIYVNGKELLKVNVGSIPKISKGTFYLDSKPFVQYQNVEVCDYAWNQKRLDAYLEGK